MSSKSPKVIVLGRIALILLILAITGGLLRFSPLFHDLSQNTPANNPANQNTSQQHISPSGTSTQTSGQAGESQEPIFHTPVSNGPYTVRGNTIYGANGHPYLFHGIARDGLQYSCTGDGHFDDLELSYMGPGTSSASVTYWGANTVRLPLSEGIWLHGLPKENCTATQYHTLVKQIVDSLTDLGLNVMIDLQWNDAGGQSGAGGSQWPMADVDSVTFWQQMALIYQGYNNVLFELFNEPVDISWSCWQKGCLVHGASAVSNDCGCTKTLTYQAVGMQTLVDTVRNAGAKNLVLVAGNNWGFDLSLIGSYPIRGSNIIYDTHPYNYYGKQATFWAAAFGVISQRYPVISAESGEYDCGKAFMQQLITYFDAHKIGWIAWSWTMAGDTCHYPRLIQDYNGTPSLDMGQYIYEHLQSYLPRPKK